MNYYIVENTAIALDYEIQEGYVFTAITEQQYNDIKNGAAWIVNNQVQYPTPPTEEELLQNAKNTKRMQIETAFNNAVNALPYTLNSVTVTYPMLPGGRTWNEAVALQAGLQGVPDAATINQPIVGNDGVLTFATAAEWRVFYAAMMGQYSVFATNRALKNAAINAATTIAQVEGIVW